MQPASYIPGLPRRMGEQLSALFAKDRPKKSQLRLLADIQSSRDEVPLTADEDSIFNAADRASRECYEAMTRCVTIDAGLLAVEYICEKWDVDVPEAETDDLHEIINRVVDLRWWRRQLRKVVARRVEHAAIKLGIVGKGRQPYLSDESVLRQVKRNKANRKALESVEMVNELGEIYKLSDLADKGTGNKEKRRHELMTRIRGFEEVAMLLNHAALFWTITCPSKFHAVGGTNAKYNGASPRDAQRYLCEVWARIRAQLDREGIRPYGFRVAEPHTDGCPHWHMLFFVERKDVQRMAQIVYEHAMREDGDESGAKENRVKLVNIEHGNGGSAAAYIAKYIAKNIDGTGVGDHTAFDDVGAGETVKVKPQVLEKMVITPAMRVSAWAQIWGIRQFQQIGGVPVGIYREMRRVPEDEIKNAPEAMRKAWEAVQAERNEQGEVTKQADFAGFMQALGGPRTGRSTLIQLAKKPVKIKGRYATYEMKKPVGVYAVEDQERVYKSVRYVWKCLDEVVQVPDGVPTWERVKIPGVVSGVGGTRTGVNNCTYLKKNEFIRQGRETLKNQKICSAGWAFERNEGEKIEVGPIDEEERSALRDEIAAASEKTRSDMETYRERRKNAAAARLVALQRRDRKEVAAGEFAYLSESAAAEVLRQAWSDADPARKSKLNPYAG